MEALDRALLKKAAPHCDFRGESSSLARELEEIDSLRRKYIALLQGGFRTISVTSKSI